MGPLIFNVQPRNFYPRSPCGERRVTVLGIQHRLGISIHALLAESDISEFWTGLSHQLFLSTLSLRRATRESADDMFQYEFLSTLSLRRATSADCNCHNARPISIHALLAESDARSASV